MTSTQNPAQTENTNRNVFRRVQLPVTAGGQNSSPEMRCDGAKSSARGRLDPWPFGPLPALLRWLESRYATDDLGINARPRSDLPAFNFDGLIQSKIRPLQRERSRSHIFIFCAISQP